MDEPDGRPERRPNEEWDEPDEEASAIELEEDDEGQHAGSAWPVYLLIGLLVLAAVVGCVIALTRADPDTRARILSTIGVFGAVALIATLVSFARQCSWWMGLAYTLAGVFVVFLFLLAALLALIRSDKQTTLRPRNHCFWCGHSWYPRGINFSPRCPKCGRAR